VSGALRQSILHGWAQTLFFLGLNRAALRAFQDVVRVVPAHAEAWSVLGFLYSQRGEMSEAVAAFEKALVLRGDDPALFFNAGFAMQRAGNHERAMALFQRAVAMDPKLDRAWYGLGLSLAHVGRYEEALTQFREAARLQPFNPYAGYHLAAVLHKLGRRDEAKAEYLRVKDFDPKVSALMRREFAIEDPDA
jgi:Flp pilus assembly protein TadD